MLPLRRSVFAAARHISTAAATASAKLQLAADATTHLTHTATTTPIIIAEAEMLPALRRLCFAPTTASIASKSLRGAVANYSSSSSSKPSSPADGSRSSPRPLLDVATQVPRGKLPGSGIPYVPSTDHLHPSDVALSTFYAMHRPISIDSHFPPSSAPRNPPRHVEPPRVAVESPWDYGVPFRPPPVPEEQEEGRIMKLISVRRQRKLKMKKHKYKKLMKRTRNERRRVERQKS